MGTVVAGAINVSITRQDGGVVKISTLPKGKFFEEFEIPLDGVYNILMTSNMSVYNYPLLEFSISMMMHEKAGG